MKASAKVKQPCGENSTKKRPCGRPTYGKRDHMFLPTRKQPMLVIAVFAINIIILNVFLVA